VPQRYGFRHFGREVDMGCAFAPEELDGLVYLYLQLLFARGGHVDQHLRRGYGDVGGVRLDGGQVFHRAQRAALDVLCGGDASGRLDAVVGELADGPRARMRIGEDDEVGRLVRVLVDGAIGHLGDEAKRAFRTDDKMDQDV